MGDLIQRADVPDGKVTLQVDARSVFRAAMSKVDEALDILRGPATDAAAALRECDDKSGMNLSSLVNAFVKTTDIRAKLAAEQSKQLVEMQKDLNRCAIERERIAASAGGVDLNQLTEAQLAAMLGNG